MILWELIWCGFDLMCVGVIWSDLLRVDEVSWCIAEIWCELVWFAGCFILWFDVISCNDWLHKVTAYTIWYEFIFQMYTVVLNNSPGTDRYRIVKGFADWLFGQDSWSKLLPEEVANALKTSLFEDDSEKFHKNLFAAAVYRTQQKGNGSDYAVSHATINRKWHDVHFVRKSFEANHKKIASNHSK